MSNRQSMRTAPTPVEPEAGRTSQRRSLLMPPAPVVTETGRTESHTRPKTLSERNTPYVAVNNGSGLPETRADSGWMTDNP